MIVIDEEVIIDEGKFENIKALGVSLFRSGGTLVFSPTLEDGTPEIFFDEVNVMFDWLWESESQKKSYKNTVKRAIKKLPEVQDERQYPALS